MCTPRDTLLLYSGFQLRWKSTESGFRHGNIIVPGMFEELLVMSFSAEPNRRRPYMTEIFVGELCSSALVWDYSTIKSRKI